MLAYVCIINFGDYLETIFKTNKLCMFLIVLTDQASKFDFIVDKELNKKAAYKMALLHDTLKDHGYTGHNLEVYLIRLSTLGCFYYGLL
jgi:hypothetical protein